MAPPFSTEQFFQVFIAYNTAVWPVQFLFLGLAGTAVWLAFRSERWAGRIIASILALLWAWMAIAYHWAFFSQINPMARVFAGAFLLEAALLLWAGFGRGLSFRPDRDLYGIVGGSFITYALVLYPTIGLALGHRYPAQPTFGLPCPTTIFTMGLLLWARPKVPWPLLVVPVLWSIVGMTAVRYFGVYEDAFLPIAAIGGASLIMLRNRQPGIRL